MANTQVIIKIAGKQKAVQFSTPTVAAGFVKDASAKFGKQFQFIGAIVPGAGDRPDQCPMCHSTRVFYTRSDGQQLDLMNPATFDQADVVNCAECGHKWPFKIVFNENEIQQDKGNKRNEEVEQAWNAEPHMASEYHKEAAISMYFPGQVAAEFAPDMLDSLYGQPTDTHTDVNDVDALSSQLDGALDTGVLSMVPTSSGNSGMGLGNSAKGEPYRDPEEIRGPAYMDAYYSAYAGGAPAINVLAKKAAKGEEAAQLTLFLKRLMGEVCASFIAMFKTNTCLPMNKVPGLGTLQLDAVEQAPTFGAANMGSRIKWLMEKLTDSEIKDAMDHSFAQAAVWHEASEGGYVFEIFCRIEDIDRDSLELRYSFILGSKGI